MKVFSSLKSDNNLGTNTWMHEFGNFISISDDGKKIVFGVDANDGTNEENSGHVRIYQMDDFGLSWAQIGKDIEGDMADDLLRYSVSLLAKGQTLQYGHHGLVLMEWGQVK